MGITAYVPKKFDRHCFWTHIYRPREVEAWLQKEAKDYKWADEKLKGIMLALVEMNISGCDLTIIPFERKIVVKAKNDMIEEVMETTIKYKKSDRPESLQKKISSMVLEWIAPVKNTISVIEEQCKKYS